MAYPIQLAHLEGRRALVAGAGPVAAQKIEALIAAGASVHVVALSISPEVQVLADRIARLELREAREDDVEGAAVVIAATDDLSINRRIAAAARARGILVNAVDDPEASTFFAPAIVRRGPVTMTIGTDGASPLLSAQLRRVLEAAVPRSVSAIGELFVKMRARGLRGLASKSKLLRALADPALSALVDRGDTEAAADHLEKIARKSEEPFEPGTVAIAGAGPGSKELLTLRALDRIQRADVILHDALVEPEVLALALPGTRVVDVGRRCAGAEKATPSMIIALMIREAQSGARVVRLHAGDPFVFGRGGDEGDALDAAGIRWELVPGVSSVLASAAAAKVPLTKRGEARGFFVRTGHGTGGYEAPVLARGEETIVVLMGLGGAREVLAGLVAEGMSPDTPAAAVSCASRANERVLSATLATLADKIEAETLEGPATLIIGKVAKRARDSKSSKGSAAGEAA